MEAVNNALHLCLQFCTLLLIEANYPAVDSSRLLPSTNQCWLALQMNRESQASINALRLLRQWDRGLDELLTETKRRGQLWDLAWDCTAVNMRSEASRRIQLKRLCELMAWTSECDMAERPLPWPVVMSREEERK
jgi:hypothetical protein